MRTVPRDNVLADECVIEPECSGTGFGVPPVDGSVYALRLRPE